MKQNFPSAADLQIIQQSLADNDQSALKKLYDLYGNTLFQFAHAFIRSREMAEEIVEDVFIQVWKKRERLRNIENLTWYLYISTRNICHNYHRKYISKKFVSLDEVTLPYYQITITPEDAMISTEVVQRINQTINELPTKCRLIFKLVKEDGLKYKEVALLLNLTQKTVENQMGIALKKLHAGIGLDMNKATKDKANSV